MNDNKILQAIDYLEAQKRLFPNSFNVLSGHFDTAISALQYQTEREKGCECCTAIETQNQYGRTFYKTIYEDIGPSHINGDVCLCHDKDGWFIHYEDSEGEEMCDCKTNFCPNCGRDLRKPVSK